VKRFAEQHGLDMIAMDAYGFTDATRFFCRDSGLLP